jgi:hypothetical protein
LENFEAINRTTATEANPDDHLAVVDTEPAATTVGHLYADQKTSGNNSSGAGKEKALADQMLEWWWVNPMKGRLLLTFNEQIELALEWCGARFSTGFCTRGCHWISRMCDRWIPLGSPLLLPADTVNCVQTLKGID